MNRLSARFLSIGVPAFLLAASVQAGPILLQNATATFSQAGFPVSNAIDGSADANTGWAIFNFVTTDTTPQTAVFETQSNTPAGTGTNLTFNLFQLFQPVGNPFHTIGDFRLSVTTDVRGTFAAGSVADWTVLTPLTALATGGAILTPQPDGSLLATDPAPGPATSTYTVTAFTNLTGITGVRLEVLADPSLPTNGPGRQPSNGNFVLSEFTMDASAVPEPGSLSLLFAGSALMLLAVGSRKIARR